MAAELIRPAGILAMSVVVWTLSGCRGNAQPIASVSSRDAIRLTTASFAAVYGAVDDALIDAYFVDGLLHPAMRRGAGVLCMKTDNSLGSRPSVITNPLLPASSVAQRARLVQVLATYDVAIASLAVSAPSVDDSIAISDLQRAVLALSAAANRHAQGDLFIEDLASSLTAPTAKLTGARGRDDVRRGVLEMNPMIVKLGNVLAIDVARWHTEASNASRLDYERWLAYYTAARRASSAKRSLPRTVIPRCLAPDDAPNNGSPMMHDPTTDGAKFAGRDEILARLQTARDRYYALQTADPTVVLASLSNLNDSVIEVLESTGDARATDTLQHAVTRFQSAARMLSMALLPLERHPVASICCGVPYR